MKILEVTNPQLYLFYYYDRDANFYAGAYKYTDTNYNIYTSRFNHTKFEDNPTFTLSTPFGARGCRTIKNVEDTRIVQIKNVFDYEGLKELNSTVFDMKEICLYKNFFQNSIYDLKAMPVEK
jgi:hypothetical protein